MRSPSGGSSRLTELGPRIHAFANEDEAYDALAEAHHDPDAIPLPTLAAESPSDRPLGADQDTPTSLGRVHPLRPGRRPNSAPADAAESFDDGPAAA